MATITATDMTGLGAKDVTETTLTASDTFTYNSSKRQVLVLNNGTGGPLTVNIDGDGGTTVPVRGLGNVDVSGGYDIGPIADGEIKAIQLDTISKYLQGTIAVTGGTDIVAQLLEF